jgi:hypothetical protein
MSVTDNREAIFCVVCGNLFLARRKDARYCSAKCRKRASRGGVKAIGKPHQAHYDQAKTAMYRMAEWDAQNAIKSIVLLGLELLDDRNKRKIWDALRTYEFED